MKATYVLEMLSLGKIELLRQVAKEEAQKEVSNRLGNAKLLSGVKKMLKATHERNQGYTLFNDKYYFTDGYRVLESATDLGFEASSNQLPIDKVTHDFEGKLAEIDVLKLHQIIAENKQIEKRNKEIKKEYKGTSEINKPYLEKQMYIVNEEIAFNPQFMLEMIEATGTNIIHYQDSKSACYFGDNYRNILLPVRMKK